MQAEKLFEEIEIVDNVKDEDAFGRNCEESLENYVYFDIGQMFGVILVAAFIALSESKKVTTEDYSDKAEERCAGLDKCSCCGKVYKNRVALAIHARRIHRKCSCHLGIAVTALQCNACEIKYPIGDYITALISLFNEVGVE